MAQFRKVCRWGLWLTAAALAGVQVFYHVLSCVAHWQTILAGTPGEGRGPAITRMMVLRRDLPPKVWLGAIAFLLLAGLLLTLRLVTLRCWAASLAAAFLLPVPVLWLIQFFTQSWYPLSGVVYSLTLYLLFYHGKILWLIAGGTLALYAVVEGGKRCLSQARNRP